MHDMQSITFVYYRYVAEVAAHSAMASTFLAHCCCVYSATIYCYVCAYIRTTVVVYCRGKLRDANGVGYVEQFVKC